MKKKIICVVVASMAGVAMADLTHTVNNPGFELIDTANTYYLEDETGHNWSGENGISSWSKVYNEAGSSATGDPTYYQIPAYGGDQAAQSGKAYHNYQKLSDTYVAGRTYTFSLWAAAPSGYDGRLYLYLADASTGMVGKDAWSSSSNKLVESPAFNLAKGSGWTNLSVSYEALAADAGKPIGINVYSSYYGTCFDDVTVTSIPEPATLGSIALMGGSLLWIRKRFMI